MTVIEIHNPYFDRTYEVVEDKEDIEYTLRNINKEHSGFLHLHDFETGDPITISPSCCASVEIIL